VLLAVKVEAVATPLLLVAAVVVTVPLANVPLAPLDGAVNVTVTFGTKFPEASFTVACSAVANAVAMLADCPLPVVAAMDAAAPGLLVRLKLAAVLTPETEADTL
jgi:hypothetical protein